mmetsp:Transcript_64440/g.145337  ORF Transcript_64440/g.145337 Transcript_64440/m.145337 type:complete len:163 (+) Transcript_64440:391-879(+)
MAALRPTKPAELPMPLTSLMYRDLKSATSDTQVPDSAVSIISVMGIVLACTLFLLGIVKFFGWKIDRGRRHRKQAKIEAYENDKANFRKTLEQSKRKKLSAAAIEKKVSETFPERDWDEEELDENANEPNSHRLWGLAVGFHRLTTRKSKVGESSEDADDER